MADPANIDDHEQPRYTTRDRRAGGGLMDNYDRQRDIDAEGQRAALYYARLDRKADIASLTEENNQLWTSIEISRDTRREARAECAARVRSIASSLDITQPEGKKAIDWLLRAASEWEVG